MKIETMHEILTNKEIIKAFVQKKLDNGAEKAIVDAKKLRLKKMSYQTLYDVCKEERLSKKVKGRNRFPITGVVKIGKQRNSDLTRATIHLN